MSCLTLVQHPAIAKNPVQFKCIQSYLHKKHLNKVHQRVLIDRRIWGMIHIYNMYTSGIWWSLPSYNNNNNHNNNNHHNNATLEGLKTSYKSGVSGNIHKWILDRVTMKSLLVNKLWILSLNRLKRHTDQIHTVCSSSTALSPFFWLIQCEMVAPSRAGHQTEKMGGWKQSDNWF